MNNGKNITMISELPELEDMDPKIQKHIRVHKTQTEQYHPQYIESENYNQPPHPPPPMRYNKPVYNDVNPVNPLQYNCIDIARHVEQCPICSRFYHCDKTFYIIIIAILAVVCLLLMKKILGA